MWKEANSTNKRIISGKRNPIILFRTMKVASVAVYTRLILFLVILDRKQDPSSLDLMKRDFMDYEDLKVRDSSYHM